MKSSKYYGRIDGLRALAALIVIAQHYLPLETPFFWTLHYGRLGVDIFFVISGFLITNILLGHRELIEAKASTPLSSWGTFYFRRILRIFPLYYGAVLAMIFLDISTAYRRRMWHLFYASNFGPMFLDSRFGNLSHFWSLCVEEQFYLLIPIPILLFSRQTSLRVVSLFAALCFVAKVLLAFYFEDWKIVAFSTMGNIEGLFYGALLAYGLRFEALERALRFTYRYISWFALALFSALMWYRYSLKTTDVQDTVVYICLIDIAIALSFGQLVYIVTRTQDRLNFLNNPVLRYLGKISYGLYVYHYLLMPFIPKWLTFLGMSVRTVQQDYASCAASWLVVILVSALSWHLIESPILRLKDRKKTARTPQVLPKLALLLLSIGVLCVNAAVADAPTKVEPKKVSRYLPVPGEVFSVRAHVAWLIEPASQKILAPKPWIFYAHTLPNGNPRTEHKGIFQKLIDSGVSIAGIDVGESYGNPAGRALFSALYEELVKKRGFSPKPCLLAQSRGGLQLYNWAAEHAQDVACIGGVFPIGDITKFPGIKKASIAYRMTQEKFLENLAQNNPIDKLAPLAKAGVPILHIVGDQDTLAPVADHSAVVAERYRKLGGQMKLIVIPGEGHELKDIYFLNPELLQFLISHSKGESLAP